MTGRYVVRAVRSIRRTDPAPAGPRTEERVIATYVLGPFRLRLTAALVAWLESYGSGGWVQRCTVEQIAEGGE